MHLFYLDCNHINQVNRIKQNFGEWLQ
jgi:hypothetical protein